MSCLFGINVCIHCQYSIHVSPLFSVWLGIFLYCWNISVLFRLICCFVIVGLRRLALSYLDTTISNEVADCTSHSLSNYDLANALNTGMYDYEDFIAAPSCNTSVNPTHLGYNFVLSGADFSTSMDVRTLVDSMAVNFGLLPLYQLNAVSGISPTTYTYRNNTYTGRYYADTWYPGMRPLFCISNNDQNPDLSQGVKQKCFMIFGNITGVPIFLHYGAGGYPPYSNSPMPCDW